MGIVYHGSSESGLTKLEPHKSTHGEYLYATPVYELAIHFSKKCGDDLTYDIGKIEGEDKPYVLVEKIPGALELMYDTTSSIYTLPSDTFKDIHTGFEEVVSTESVEPIKEEKITYVYDEIMRLSEKGLLTIYRYPNKPKGMPTNGEDIINKYRFYKNKLGMDMPINKLERLVFLHPYLLEEVNKLAKEFGTNVKFTKEDLVRIFEDRVKRQLHDLEHVQFIECAYPLIIGNYPELSEEITPIYNYYLEELENKKKVIR